MKMYLSSKVLLGIFLISLLSFGATSCTSHRTTGLSAWQDLNHSRDLSKKRGVQGSRKHVENKRKYKN